MSPNTRFEQFFDELPTTNFRIFVAVLTSVVVTLWIVISSSFGMAPTMSIIISTYAFLGGWMGIETAHHFLKRKTYDPDLPTRQNQRASGTESEEAP